jgi:hypothetical protein
MKGYPKRFVIFDTETNENVIRTSPREVQLTLRLGCAIVQDSAAIQGKRGFTSHFNTSGEFHAIIQDMPLSRDTIYIFAHNIGFDARIVEFFRFVALGHYSLLPPMSVAGYGRYKVPLYIAESPPFIVRLWRRDGQQLMLLDSFQWLSKSLAAIGEEIGHAKGTMPKAEATDSDWAEYCERDCQVLLRAMERLWEFLTDLRMPDFCPTPASQSMMLYKMRYEKKRITRPENLDVFKLDRLAYYGGQVEAFFIGIHERMTYQVDVTSLYPFVMMDNPYPCAVEEVCDDPTPKEPGNSFDPRVTTAEVYLDSNQWPYPVRGSDETLWCRGKVRCVLCGPELERAWNMGHIKFVGRYVRYLMDDLFSDYVSWLWDKRDSARRSGDKFTSDLCKILLNSLHGKFGQRTGDWHHHGREQPHNMYGTGKMIGDGIESDTDYRIMAGHMYSRCRDEEDKRGFVPIAAWCASYARCFMHDARNCAGEDHCLYQATDSLLIDGEGLAGIQLAGMLDGNRMGTFRHEETHEWVAIHGVHSLDTPKSRKRPGVPKSALQVASETYEISRWEGFQNAISTGNVSSVSISNTYTHCNLTYGRRFVSPDGRTVPHAVNNWSVPPEDMRHINVRSLLIPGI